MLDSSLINEMVLGVTAFVLLSGSAGLLLVSWSSPLLRGLVWVSASFLLGGVSALLTAAQAHVSAWVSHGLADLLTLGCFVLLDLAVREMHDGDTPRVGRVSYVLVLTQLALAAVSLSHHGAGPFHSVGAATIIAVQACFSAWTLLRKRGETARAPALLCAYLLLAAAVLRVWRGGMLAAGLFPTTLRTIVDTGISMTLLAVILGVAFGFFWMSSSVFAHGLEHMASTDPLTRIFNRRTFLLWCEKEVGRSLVSGIPFSLLLLDLDHFKRVNDAFGHAVGDRLLCSVVERVQDGVRGIDVLGRWGGEEFAVLLPRASADAAWMVAERVRGNIERSTLLLTEAEARDQSRLLQATSSVGTATFRGPGDSIKALFERADTALYEAKRGGRNCTRNSQRRQPASMPTHSTPAALPAGVLQEASHTAPELVL